jgi:hypothetical protein
MSRHPKQTTGMLGGRGFPKRNADRPPQKQSWWLADQTREDFMRAAARLAIPATGDTAPATPMPANPKGGE